MNTQKMKSQNLTNLMTPDCQRKRRKRYLYLSTTAWKKYQGSWAYGTETGIQKLFSYRMQRQK